MAILATIVWTTAELWWPGSRSRSRPSRSRKPRTTGRAKAIPLVPVATVDQAIEAMAAYLKGQLDRQGRFTYLVDLDDRPVPKQAYNVLRHAGTIYALSQYHALTGDPATREAILRAARYLKARYFGPVLGRLGLAAIWSRPEEEGKRTPTAKLGGSALGLIALLAAHALDPAAVSLAELRSLGELIRFMQRSNGSFFSTYRNATGYDRTFHSLYYPGEAMLALSQLYRVDRDRRWLAAAVAAARYLLRSREEKSRLPNDHWFMIAAAALEPQAAADDDLSLGQLALRAHSLRLAQQMLADKRRIDRSSPVGIIGGFVADGRTTPTSTNLEGLLALCRSLPAYDPFRQQLLSTASQSLRWLRRSLVTDGKYRGGMPRAARKLTGPQQDAFNRQQRQIRIDYVQHALSAFIAYRRMVATDHLSLVGADAVSYEDYPRWLRQHVAALYWVRPLLERRRMSPAILAQSLDRGRAFLLRNQRDRGNFNYQLDLIGGQHSGRDNSVRQAGTLWSLASLYRQRPNTQQLRAAVRRGLRFFFDRSQPGPQSGSLAIVYPGEQLSKTGTVALVTLAIVEYLRANPAADHAKPDAAALRAKLDGYLAYLGYMQERASGPHFAQAWSPEHQRVDASSSPYADGEALLALVKAAKYLGRRRLIPIIESVAPRLAWFYTVGCWRTHRDSKTTKGFFQWGSMAFWEHQDAGWKHAALLGDAVLALSHWMIWVHQTLQRPGNTAYAYEGIIHAYQIARARKLFGAARMLAATIDRGLYKLTSWQVGGPLAQENTFLASQRELPPMAVGGVLNAQNAPLLRIDVTQHQMHAVQLALTRVYAELAATRPE